MAAEIVQFPQKSPPIEPLAQFIRLGEVSHKRTASLFTEGHLAAKRVVIDASRIRFLKSEIKQFKEDGREIVLDTKAAELAALSKLGKSAWDAPWSQVAGGQLVGMACFLRGHPGDIFGSIARCATTYDVDVVLSPSHFLHPESGLGWLDVDRASCLQLRDALDREGGKHIAIDHLLIVPHLMLNDPDMRLKIMQALSDLPYDNLWIRASGFGNDSPAQPLAALISALGQLHNLGKPIITDYLGGLVGEAVMALGASSGFAHGISECERFDARPWDKPAKERDPDKPGGRTTRISLSLINKSLTLKEYETLLSAKSAKRLLAPSVALSGVRTASDIINEPKILASKEAVNNFETLANVPNLHRAKDFVERRVEPAVERMRQIKNLVPNQEVARAKDVDLDKLMKRMGEHHKHLSRQSNSLAELSVRLSDIGPTARPVQRLSRLEEHERRGQRR
jgi:hypothetical protein